MHIVSLLINVLVGSFFILSAWLKVHPIEYFEAKISAFGPSGWLNSFSARVIIGIELGIGLFLVLQYTFGKKLQLITIVLLGIFVVVNLVDYVQHGNDTNCGCMGMNVSISPLMSILKNVVLIGLMVVSRRFSTIELNARNSNINLALCLLPVCLTFIYKPVYILNDPQQPMKGKTLDFTVMMHHKGLKGITFKDDLTKGKKVVAFLSITCPHCKLAAFKLTQYKTQDPTLPVYFIINGDSVDMPEFFRVTGASHMPMAHFNGQQDYANLSGYELPSIYLMKDGLIERQLNNGNLDKQTITGWLAQ